MTRTAAARVMPRHAPCTQTARSRRPFASSWSAGAGRAGVKKYERQLHSPTPPEPLWAGQSALVACPRLPPCPGRGGAARMASCSVPPGSAPCVGVPQPRQAPLRSAPPAVAPLIRWPLHWGACPCARAARCVCALRAPYRAPNAPPGPRAAPRRPAGLAADAHVGPGGGARVRWAGIVARACLAVALPVTSLVSRRRSSADAPASAGLLLRRARRARARGGAGLAGFGARGRRRVAVCAGLGQCSKGALRRHAAQRPARCVSRHERRRR